jgi:glycosyltransferase involved in cell wall biosynthesis
LSQKRILHVIETDGPGGAESMLVSLVSHLDREKFASKIFLPTGGWLAQALTAAGSEIIPEEKQRHAITQLRQIVREYEPDLIHAHLPDSNFYAAAASFVEGSETIVTYHGALDPRWKSRLKARFAFLRASRVVAVSDHLRRELIAAGAPKSRTVRVHNGVELRPPGNRLVWRQRLGIPESAKLIGTIANVRPSKAYDVLIAAAAEVNKRAPETHFIAAGEPHAEIIPMLETMIDALGLRGRFHFVGHRDDVQDLLAAMDIFVLSSTSEGFSIATIEAMAAHKPCVVTRSGCPEEIIENEKTGLLVPTRDASALAEAIARVLESPSESAVMAEHARTAVEQRFSVGKMVKAYAELYCELLGC